MASDTTTLAPTDDLQKRCAEIIGWHRTGVLVGDTLRSHAESKWPGDIHNLQMAERATENEALCFIAKWGAPAPASGELVAEVMFDERKYIQYTIPLELLPVGAKFYTAPEVRVPLSDAEALAIVRSVPALFTAEDEWLYCIREVEHHHGITAAQKEAT